MRNGFVGLESGVILRGRPRDAWHRGHATWGKIKRVFVGLERPVILLRFAVFMGIALVGHESGVILPRSVGKILVGSSVTTRVRSHALTLLFFHALR